MTDFYELREKQGRAHFSQDLGDYYFTAGTTDPFDRVDVYATARTKPSRTYAIEIKDYTNGGYERNYTKYIRNGKDNGYQIDLQKLQHLQEEADKENRIPILYVRFGDYTYAWNIAEINYEDRRREVWVNKSGANYGKEKELAWQTYLYANEAVWSKPTPKNN